MDKGEQRLLQIGGLAGVLSGILPILFIFVFQRAGGGFITAENLRLIVQSRTSFAIGVALEFVGALLLIPLFLALYRLLRQASVGYALLGTVLGIFGATFSAVSAMMEAQTLFLADLYDKAATADKNAVLTLAQAVGAFGGSFFPIYVVFLGLGLTAIGAAMFGDRAFRKAYGWLSIISGLGLIAGLLLLLAFLSPAGFLFFLPAFIIWPVVIGLKVYRLSRRVEKS